MSILHRSIAVAFAGLLALSLAMAGTAGGCGPGIIWECNNPDSGKADPTLHDDNHSVNGVFDPCHCYDPCGPLPQCPIVVDAGPPCDAGTGGGH